MDIGKIIKIHTIPEPQEPKRIPIGPEKNPFQNPEEEPIPAPNWPVKVPEKVEA